MGRYRKKPVVIDAIQYRARDGLGNFADWPAWAKDALKHRTDDGLVVARTDPAGRTITNLGHSLCVETLEGVMRVDDGDWIIKGVKGELYPCKPDIFAATYEEVVERVLNPTIAELEKILEEPSRKVTIHPDGSVTAELTP